MRSPDSGRFDPTSPRGRSSRCLLAAVAALLVLVLFIGFFPESVQQAHCKLGYSTKCTSTGVSLHVLTRAFDRSLAKASCTPRKEGGKVVLVTGSAGFIGFSAGMELLARGDGFIGIDNFNDYYPVSLKAARTAQLEQAGGFTVDGDVNDDVLLEDIFQLCRPTHVLHLAAQAGVRYAAANPLSYIDSNVRATTTLFEAVKRQTPMPLVVYASSSSVYGRNERVPFSEVDRVDVPASLYAATKRSCELIASVYNNLDSMSVTGLRFFTVYGPWGRPDMAALAFAHSIAEGRPIKIFQGPNGTELARDFTYIDDIVQGILGAVDSAEPGMERLYNLGNTHPHTVSDFVTLLEKALKKKAIRDYVQMPQLGDVLQTHSNITRAQLDFQYSPSVSLADGLQHFADWFYSYYGADGRHLKSDELRYTPYR